MNRLEEVRHLTVRDIRAMFPRSSDRQRLIEVHENWRKFSYEQLIGYVRHDREGVKAYYPYPIDFYPGTWKLNPTRGEYEVLVWLPLHVLSTNNMFRELQVFHDGKIHLVEKYMEFATERYAMTNIFPPIETVEHVNQGIIVNDGIKRVMAARRLGMTAILGWFSATGKTDDEPMTKWQDQRRGSAWEGHKIEYPYEDLGPDAEG